MDFVAQTRELFAPLITSPEMKESLVSRPPFKFIHSIVTEIIKATGYLDGSFSSDELEYAKASKTKESKAAFLTKLKGYLNTDGSLNDVNPKKIASGLESELTNLLLQKLAINAASVNIGRETRSSSKSKSKTRSTSSSKKSKDRDKKEVLTSESNKKEKEREIEREKRRLSKASILATNDKEKKKLRSKSKDKEVKSDKERKKAKKTTENNEADLRRVEREESPPRRESSGGTSKGDDSGIAEESERHDTSRLSRRMSASSNRELNIEDVRQFNQISLPQNINAVTSPHREELRPEEDTIQYQAMNRPSTASARPRTQMGRPGTAAARPAPPKPRKTKVVDIDPSTVNHQPVSTEKSTVITENTEVLPDEDEGFLVDDEENKGYLQNEGADINKIIIDSNDHGTLINKIIENTKELDKSGIDSDSMGFDPHEHKKLKLEMEAVQEGLQKSAQTVQPLATSLEYISEDLVALLKEVDLNRRSSTMASRQSVELRNKTGEAAASLSAQLRNMKEELKETRSQIAKTMSSVIANEKRIKDLITTS